MIDATFEFGRYPINLEKGRVKGCISISEVKPKPKEKVQLAADLSVETYVSALLDSDIPRLIDLVQKDIDSGVNPSGVVQRGLIPAMAIIGKQFQGGQIYIPEMMLAAKAMSETLSHFKNNIATKSNEKHGTVIIGTVKGDLHDIGKNLVIMMLEGTRVNGGGWPGHFCQPGEVCSGCEGEKAGYCSYECTFDNDHD